MHKHKPFAHTFKVVQGEWDRLWLLSPTLAYAMSAEYKTRMEGGRPRLSSSTIHYLDYVWPTWNDKQRKNIVRHMLNLNSLLVQYERHSSPIAKHAAILLGVQDEWRRVPPGRRK